MDADLQRAMHGYPMSPVDMEGHDILLPLACRRLALITHKGIVKDGHLLQGATGAYQVEPMRTIEYAMHEIAHSASSGVPFNKHFNKNFKKFLSRVSVFAANEMEIDTAAVTYLAGQRLCLWEDPGAIINSTYRNLFAVEGAKNEREVRERFLYRVSMYCLNRGRYPGDKSTTIGEMVNQTIGILIGRSRKTAMRFNLPVYNSIYRSSS